MNPLQSFFHNQWFPLAVALIIIWTCVTITVLLIGYASGTSPAYYKDDYCSADEWGFAEYCIIGGKGLQCDTFMEEYLCREHALLLGELEK